MTIKVISDGNIGLWAKDKHIKEPHWEDLTDEQFSEINEEYDCGWHFDSLEEFINAFNRDDDDCPVPVYHFLRVYGD